MVKLRQTPSQTVGPYFAYGLSPEQYGYGLNLSSIAGPDMAPGDVEGTRIRVEGHVYDGAGVVVPRLAADSGDQRASRATQRVPERSATSFSGSAVSSSRTLQM